MKTAANDNDYRYGTPNQFFEYWSNLAKTDPERFELERKDAIEKVILGGRPECQQIARRLQWRIDAERMRAKNPIDAMVRLNKMMWRQVFDEGGFLSTRALWGQISILARGIQKLTNGSPQDAKLLPFKKD